MSTVQLATCAAGVALGILLGRLAIFGVDWLRVRRRSTDPTPLTVGQPPSAEHRQPSPCCGAMSPRSSGSSSGWRCTRPRGHDSPWHAASAGNLVVAGWNGGTMIEHRW